MFRQKSVDTKRFAMVPRADVPRSSFRIQKALKTTFDSGFLVPVFVEEILPGDMFTVKMTAFARMATPIVPIMDNLYLESFFFFVPNRLVWSNWRKFMGEQDNPGDSISYTIPQVSSINGGHLIGSLYDHMGLPTQGQVDPGFPVTHSALPMRAYNLIYHNWFRDENLNVTPAQNQGDGPDVVGDYTERRRGKRHDYFTSCLPWPQKGATAMVVPGVTGTVPVIPDPASGFPVFKIGTGGAARFLSGDATNVPKWTGAAFETNNVYWSQSGLVANLSSLTNQTNATINSLRTAFQIQRFLERDARGGTRYTEWIFAHFGVNNPDQRLQRSEYLGGGRNSIAVSPIAQTSESGTTPLGELAAFATSLSHAHGFTASFVEHGYVIGIVNVRADLTYQQGLRRHWSRLTRYDFYVPAFAHLGEQAVLSKEIYFRGVVADDDAVFGYQERWAEYRSFPSEICGLFRSTATGTIDRWHLAQRFTTRPTLNETFIYEQPPLSRILAVGAAADSAQFLMDAFFDIKAARPLPMFSVPGMADHF